MIYFIFGEDDFRSQEKIVALKKKFLQSLSASSGFSDFDFEVKNFFREFLETVKTPNMLNPKRLVIARDLIKLANAEQQEEILEYLKKENSLIQDKDLSVVIRETTKVASKNKLFQWLKKNAKSQEFEKMSGAKIEQWVLKRIATLDEKVKIEKEALMKLIAYTGGETRALANEIVKLINNSENGKITSSDVEEVVKADLDSNIFETIDALGNNRKKEALKLLHHHLEKGEDPFYLFSMIVFQFRNLIKVADCRENGMTNEANIAKETGLHPYVVKKSLRQIQNFSHKRLIKIYRRLAQIDILVKTGKMNIILAMDKLIVEI